MTERYEIRETKEYSFEVFDHRDRGKKIATFLYFKDAAGFCGTPHAELARTAAAQAQSMDREQIAAVLYIKRFPHRTWQTASLTETALAYEQADAIIALSPVPSTMPLAEATPAQHFDLPKGEPARFVRDGELKTCQCRDCRQLVSSKLRGGE